MKRIYIVLATAVMAAVLPSGTARAAPPIEGYFNCRAVVHPHVHIGTPSKNHAKRHRCKRVTVNPLTAAPERQVGPRPETALEAYYRTRAQAAERRIQELGQEVHAATSRTEQVRQADAEVLQHEQTRLTAEILDLRGWANQLERLTVYLLPFLPPEQRGIAESVLNSR